MSGQGASGDAGNGSGAGAGAGNGAGGAAAHWYDGMSADEIGYLQNRGLDKGDARAAVQAAIRSHQEAEKLIGAPATEMLRLPKNAQDAEGWQRFNERLGVPKEAKEYDFSSLKFKDGSNLDDATAEAIKTALQTARVSKENAPIIAKAMIDLADAEDATSEADYALKLNAEREALKVNWGPNTTQNMMIVQQTAKTLGLGEDFVNTLEKSVGYSKTMDAMLKIGQAMGEDKFVMSQTGGGGSGNYMSAEQALNTLNTKMADSNWATKLQSGDSVVMTEFNTLTTIAAPLLKK